MFWPSFEDIVTQINNAETRQDAERILADAKAQRQCGKLTSDQLRALREKYHLRKERGEIRARV